MQVKTIYQTHKQLIFTSSLIIGITVFLALNTSSELEDMWFNNNDDNDGEFNFINLNTLNNNSNSNPHNISEVLLDLPSVSASESSSVEIDVEENIIVKLIKYIK